MYDIQQRSRAKNWGRRSYVSWAATIWLIGNSSIVCLSGPFLALHGPLQTHQIYRLQIALYKAETAAFCFLPQIFLVTPVILLWKEKNKIKF